jgi:hypothetical protein
MEKHAAKIYTRTMFEKFQDFLYKSGSYYVDQVVPGERYVAKHFDSDIREKWCKVQYEVSVSDGYYTCECGMYEHMGMLCCHVLKVESTSCLHFIFPLTWQTQLVNYVGHDVHFPVAGSCPP